MTQIIFLKAVKLKRLSDHQKEVIREVFTTSEIEAAIKAFPEKKAPGIDGLPIEFYSIFWPNIRPLFLEVVNSFVNQQKLPETMYLSTISVIPKPGRECNKPSDFRLISLINCDKKIITKVMNNRLAPILPSIIH
uniref:Reverse transcriptase domain-containing protein n=1 Tax=Esox lucius TaxID=8010 RepID=A0A3P8YAM5_ESOLU